MTSLQIFAKCQKQILDMIDEERLSLERRLEDAAFHGRHLKAELIKELIRLRGQPRKSKRP